MVHSGKTFRIFVSSTFSDLKEERNALQREVFPKLRELCAQQGFRFQAIDLRWGISEEAGLDQQTMKICLEEIERSQRVSPKPNFILLLGDRYGWRPLPYEIPVDEFEEIKKVVSPEDEDFLFWEGDELEDEELKKREGWYCKDENAVPPVYCLKPRSVDYLDNTPDEEIINAKEKEADDWYLIENKLKSILLDAIDKLGWTEDDPRRFKYESSATEQEIIKGVLNPPDFLPTPEEHVFAFFRNMEKTDNISCNDALKDYLDFNENGTPDESSKNKLESLKEKISNKLPPTNVFNYTTEWKDKKVNTNHINILCQDVYNSIEKILLEQIREFIEKNALDHEIEAHKEFGKDRSRLFIGREKNRNKIKSYLENPNFKPMVVYGDSGSGKSALMAKAIEDLDFNFYNENKLYDDGVIIRFIGATPDSSDIRSLLESLCREITRIYGKDDSSIPSKYNQLVNYFEKQLKLATIEKPLILFLDALDQLSDSENAHNLTWIPDELPENVHIVISTLKEPFQLYIENRIPRENTNEVKPLEESEGQLILESWLSVKTIGRKLTQNQNNEVINKFKVNGFPLYLKLAFEEAKRLKSYTPTPILESDIPGIIRQMLKRLSKAENHGQILVSHSLGYLSAAKNGLTEDEMLDILALDEDVFSLTKKFHEPTEEKLPVALWSRLYFDLEPYLTERSADETSLLAFYHRQLGEVVRDEFLNENVKTDRHQLLAKYFQKHDLSFKKDGKKVYNTRKVSELPYQLTYGGCWKDLEDTLCDLRFVQAKCAVRMPYDLIEDYKLAIDAHPDVCENKNETNYKKYIDNYIKSLIAYSNEEIEHLNIIPFPKPLTERKIKKDTKDITKNSSSLPLDNIKAFSQFVNSEIQQIMTYLSIPGFCIQQAYNSANSGPLVENAQKLLNQGLSEKLVLKCDNCLSEYKSHPLQLKDLKGHTDWINAAAVTPDGEIAITGSDDKTVRIWNIKTGKLLKTLEDHADRVNSVDITPDGKIAVSGSDDKTVRIWNIKTGKLLKTLEDHKEPVASVIVTANDKLVISGSGNPDSLYQPEIKDFTIRLWDMETGEPIKTLEGHTKRVNALAVTPDQKTIISGSDDYTVRVWDIKTGKLLKTLRGHLDPVYGVGVTLDGETIISGSRDNVINLWDMKTGNLKRTFQDHSNYIYAVTFSTDGKIAISQSADSTMRILNLETGDCLKTLEGQINTVNAVAVTLNGKKIVSGSESTISLWDLETGKLLKTLEGHTGIITSVAITSDGKIAVSGSHDNTIKIWNTETGESIKTLKGHSDTVFSVAFLADGKSLISGSRDETICLWNLETGKLLRTLKGHVSNINSVKISANGKRVISKSDDNTLRVWDIKSGTSLKTIDCLTHPVNTITITPDFKIAITGNEDNTIRLWDLNTGKLINTLKNNMESVTTLTVSPEGKTIASGSKDNIVRLWDLKTGTLLKTLEDQTETITTVEFSADNNTLIFGSGYNLFLWDLETNKLIKTIKSDNNLTIVKSFFSAEGIKAISPKFDNTICVLDLETGKSLEKNQDPVGWINSVAVTSDCEKVVSGSNNLLRMWDIKTGRLLKTLEGHRGRVNAVGITSNGRIISGSDDKTVRVWDLETGKLLKVLETDTNNVISISITPDGMKIIFGKDNHTVSVWDLKTGKKKSLKGLTTTAKTLIVTKDGKGLIYGSEGNTLNLWDMETDTLSKIMVGHKKTINAITITPDGKTAISGSNDKTVRIWDIKTGKLIKTLEGHTDIVTRVSVTPDGKTAISGSNDKTVRIWDIKTGNLLKILSHKYFIDSVIISPDGKMAVSTHLTNKDILFWNLKTGKMICVFNGNYGGYAYPKLTADGHFVSGDKDIIISSLMNVPQGLPLITANRMWLYSSKRNQGRWDEDIKTDCQWCGNRFKVSDDFIHTIKSLENPYKKPDGWISDEAWDDPRLILKCPHCQGKLRSNPFISDCKMNKMEIKDFKKDNETIDIKSSNEALETYNHAILLYKNGRFDNAELYFRQALEINDKVDPENSIAATILNSLAMLLQKKEDYEGAEQLYRKAININERILGKHHHNTLQVRKNLESLPQIKKSKKSRWKFW